VAATICPTVTASEEHQFREQIDSVCHFASRVHIDLSDGIFSPEKLISINSVWWPGNVRVDLHVMYKNPFENIGSLIALGPQMIITHAEAEGDIARYGGMLHEHGIESGVALLPDTPVEKIRPLISSVDHVLVFSGKLGYYGGHLDTKLIDKVQELKDLKPTLEIGWDGGINDQNVEQLIRGGVEVLNVGGFIALSDDPQAAYAKLENIAESL
jgi:ribulose-phosphate 3-epimerase